MMAEPHLIGPPAVSTPADLKRSRGRGRDLPDDLLKAASLRLGIMSLLFAVLWVVGVVAGHLATYALLEQAKLWWGQRKAAGQGPVQGAELVVPPPRSLSMQARLYSAALAAMLVLPGVLTAQANPVADAFRDNYRDAAKNLIAAAEEFPADKLSFKPTPAQMSVGDIIVHLSQGNDYLCGSIGGVKAPTRDKVAADAAKPALIARLRETFAFCDQALAPLTDANLSEQLPFYGGRKVSRAAVMTITTGDWADHYSQYAIYLRLNGLLPPTAKKPAM